MYASRTGTRENLDLMRKHGWRLLVSAAGVWRNEGMPYALDNGAWTYAQKGKPFDGARFAALVDRLGSGADWIALPDVVGDAKSTAALTEEWLDALDGKRCLAVIQDGAEEHVLDRLIGKVHGFFLGGTDAYKEPMMMRWGHWARERSAYYHVGRVNSARRILLAVDSGAHSCDGTSVTKFARSNIARLTAANDEAEQANTIWQFMRRQAGKE